MPCARSIRLSVKSCSTKGCALNPDQEALILWLNRTDKPLQGVARMSNFIPHAAARIHD